MVLPVLSDKVLYEPFSELNLQVKHCILLNQLIFYRDSLVITFFVVSEGVLKFEHEALLELALIFEFFVIYNILCIFSHINVSW